jgi:hypothetical protein
MWMGRPLCRQEVPVPQYAAGANGGHGDDLADEIVLVTCRRCLLAIVDWNARDELQGV